MTPMNLKQFSTACAATMIAIGSFSFSAQAQTSTQKEKFFYAFVAVFKQKPQLPGDETALLEFAVMNDNQKQTLFDAGKTSCVALKAGISPEQILTMLKTNLNKQNYPKETYDLIWSSQVAILRAANYAICP